MDSTPTFPHIAVDTDGRLLVVNLTTADISDSAGAQTILDVLAKRWPWIKHLFADGAYDRRQLLDKAAFSISSSRSSAAMIQLKNPAAPMGRRAHLRMADPLSTPRARP